MARYKDKKVSIGSGYGDTNINVFTLASLPFNDVFDYLGVGYFTDKTASGEVAFKDKVSSFSEPILSQSGEYILQQGGVEFIGYYRGMLTTLEGVDSQTGFTKVKTSVASPFSSEEVSVSAGFIKSSNSVCDQAESFKRETMPVSTQFDKLSVVETTGFTKTKVADSSQFDKLKVSTSSNFSDETTNEQS